ncbi:MAG: AraC family transcriptional regulator [Tannerella sp.]|jgi:AraC-like DNA-binding protein|nr:AraC family transcriptional regulator [Tannerella sp.]
MTFDTNRMKNEQLRYLAINAVDEEWGIVVTTVGYQFISPQSPYPLSRHPDKYHFSPLNHRTLNEYQLVYITKGSGYFTSQSVKKQKISEGTMILLFPGEWHSYYPDPDTGWHEHWVGFRGVHIDERAGKHFFGAECPLFRIGHSSTILQLYEDILDMARKEKAGYQQIISSMVLHMLGSVYYKWKNNQFKDSYIEDKIIEARRLIKENLEGTLSQEAIASKLGLGYSWFRRMFKEYTGIPPAQYQIQQKLLRAKELLTDTSMNVSEVAYTLHFENTGQFSTFFRKKEGLTPSQFRKQMQP